MLRSIPTVAVSERTVKNWFHQHGKAGKYAIASFLTNQFPELSWKLPPRRKPWEPDLAVRDTSATSISFKETL
jgi:hypothetical protein